jgi:hypothetical protein
MKSLERYKGHFYNWYSTETLQPLYPRYVSTVDSGNLAASLITLKEGLTSIAAQPILRQQQMDGIIDTINVLLEKTKETGALQKLKL